MRYDRPLALPLPLVRVVREVYGLGHEHDVDRPCSRHPRSSNMQGTRGMLCGQLAARLTGNETCLVIP